MSLFTYKDDFNERAIATAIIDLKADGDDCPSGIHHHHINENGTDTTHLDVPVEALTLLSDRIMSTGRQLKVLDLTWEGQLAMAGAYAKGDDSFQRFLDDHAPKDPS